MQFPSYFLLNQFGEEGAPVFASIKGITKGNKEIAWVLIRNYWENQNNHHQFLSNMQVHKNVWKELPLFGRTPLIYKELNRKLHQTQRVFIQEKNVLKGFTYQEICTIVKGIYGDLKGIGKETNLFKRNFIRQECVNCIM